MKLFMMYKYTFFSKHSHYQHIKVSECGPVNFVVEGIVSVVIFYDRHFLYGIRRLRCVYSTVRFKTF